MATRICWSGEQIATLVDGRARLHDAGGGLVRELGFEAIGIDLGFDADDRLVTIDRKGWICTYDRAGTVFREESMRSEGEHDDASLAARGKLVARGPSVHDFAERRRWRYGADDYDVHRTSRVNIVLAPSGTRLAFAHATQPGEARPPGRGWLVIDVEPPAEEVPEPPRGRRRRAPLRSRLAVPRRPVIDRHWLQTRAEPGPTLFAFDEHGTRMIHASPESTPHVGAIRIGKDRAYTVAHPGGAHAIALDPRGIIAAYAYPDAKRRFRIDYLDPDDGEASMIEVLDSLFIEPALPDIAALAFSPDSHLIACLARSGAIEIVPVP